MSSIDNTPHAIYSNSSVTDLIDVKDAGSCNIITDDEDDIMPPLDSHKKPLTDKEKALIKQWIEEGLGILLCYNCFL